MSSKSAAQLKEKIDKLISYHSKINASPRFFILKGDDLSKSGEIPPNQQLHVPPLPKEVYELSDLLANIGEPANVS